MQPRRVTTSQAGLRRSSLPCVERHGSRPEPSAAAASARKPSASASWSAPCAISPSTATTAPRSRTSRASSASRRVRSSSTSGRRPGCSSRPTSGRPTSLPAWLDVPDDVQAEGFFGVGAFWLERTEHLIKEDWVPNRVVADRQLRHRPRAEARHQPLPRERGPLRHAGVRGVGSASAARSAPTSTWRCIVSMVDWLVELAAGRPGHRGARPRAVPPRCRPARTPAHAGRALHDAAGERDRRPSRRSPRRRRHGAAARRPRGRSEASASRRDRRGSCASAKRSHAVSAADFLPEDAPVGTSASTRGSRGTAGPRGACGT